MEDTLQQIQTGIEAAITALDTDPRLVCADTGEVMQFRVDQFTRNADGSWRATVLIRRDEDWFKVVDKSGQEIAVLSPTSMANTGLGPKVQVAKAAKGVADVGEVISG